jgi:hypothetical protein
MSIAVAASSSFRPEVFSSAIGNVDAGAASVTV